MARIHLAISGMVQGVGFRWFVRQRATSLNVAGWVANRDDGSVELAAEGDPDTLRSLVEAVRRGPPGARVDSIAELPTEALGDLPSPFTAIR